MIEVLAVLVLYYWLKGKLERKGRGGGLAVLGPALWGVGEFVGGLVASVILMVMGKELILLSTAGLAVVGAGYLGAAIGAVAAFLVVRAASPAVFVCPACEKGFTPYLKGGLARHTCHHCRAKLRISAGTVSVAPAREADEEKMQEQAPSKTASASAVARLKDRTDRGARKGSRGPRRRLSDEERQALWHKAVMRKAHKLKRFTDLLIFLLILAALGSHALPFIGEVPGVGNWEPRRGYELVMTLALERAHPHLRVRRQSPAATAAEDMTLAVRTTKVTRVFNDAEEATPMALAYLAVPGGLALLFLLYLLDYLIWMGRPLPLLSTLYGFGAVGYLLAARLPENAPWNLLGYDAALAWYLLMIPLFLLGTVSMLRFVVSQRWKRYEFAGRTAPGRAEPAPAAAPETSDGPDASGEERDERRDEADEAPEAPESGEGDEPERPEKPDEGRGDEAKEKPGAEGAEGRAGEGPGDDRAPAAPAGGAPGGVDEGPGDGPADVPADGPADDASGHDAPAGDVPADDAREES